ncbi:procathepsin L [Callithrix jacchus]
MQAMSPFSSIEKASILSDPKDLDHTILVAGYGYEGQSRITTNIGCWRKHWGMDGYIKMAKDQRSNCGIATAANYLTV